MQLTSKAFDHQGEIPAKYTCDDEDINPPLQISEVPEEAESLVLIVDDPDAPGQTFVHWTVWNLDPGTAEIAEDAELDAVEGITDFNAQGYGGPCPPSGEHRYYFRLYALDSELDLSSGADREALDEAIQEHIIDSCELMAMYSRQEEE